jgi:hypothetical protein
LPTVKTSPSFQKCFFTVPVLSPESNKRLLNAMPSSCADSNFKIRNKNKNSKIVKNKDKIIK